MERFKAKHNKSQRLVNDLTKQRLEHKMKNERDDEVSSMHSVHDENPSSVD